MEREYSRTLARQLMSFMDTEGYRYDFDEEAGVLKSSFGIEGKLGHVRIFVSVESDYFISVGTISMHADEECRANVMEFLTRANFGLTFGNFELDMDDGEIRYKYAVDCEGTEPSRAVVARGVCAPVAMFQRYGNALLQVMFGAASPEEAVDRAEAE